MIRVTIEIVPYGLESMAKTVSEICIANLGANENAKLADYEAAGYHITTGEQMQEFAMNLENYARDSGVIQLVSEILAAPQQEVSKVRLAEQLLGRTRLNEDTE